ncbi:MAG: discoidin domain-containing protein, partial [Verrucomicrobiota bacterium]
MTWKIISLSTLLVPVLLAAETGRYIRVELSGSRRVLTLAEVQVMSGGKNVAPSGKASQSSTAHGGDARRGVDGNTDPSYTGNGQTHTNEENKPWWELDLGKPVPIEQVAIYNRSDGGLGTRLDGFTLRILDASRKEVFTRTGVGAPKEIVRFEIKDKGKAFYVDRKGKVQKPVPQPVAIPA